MKKNDTAFAMKMPELSSKKIIWLLRLFLLHLIGWYLFCLIPTGGGNSIRYVSFPSGTGIKKLAQQLKNKGLIRSTTHFILMSRLRGAANRLKAGEYRLNNGMSSGEILQKIANGEADYRRFTLPEGYSIYQASELLEQKGYFAGKDFLEACMKPDLLQQFNIGADSCEGYLFPATYNLAVSDTPESLVLQMLQQFEKNYSRIVTKTETSFTKHQLITLASLIEKEAVSSDEKPLISSVFHNRLAIGMPLQSDPTAVYGVRAFAGKVSKADIERRSPYNTYLINGLPPGPIGNPGETAIRAAINPQKTDFLYFVARQDGTHQFSRTLQEHNCAVARYLK